MKKAIVTGATGSVGNGLVCELLANDYEVTVLTRRDSHRNNFIPDNDAMHKVFCSLEELKETSGIIPDKADVFFPEFDKNEWKRVVLKENIENDICFKHTLYTRKLIKK